MRLKQYPEYKESGLPWVEQIPEHWKVLPNRAIFEERNTKGMDGEDLLSVTIKRGVIRQKELIESSSKKDSSNEDKSKYKLVLEGDLPYNKMRMWQGAVGISKYRGVVSPAYIILKPRGNACPDYFHYLLRTTEYTRESHRYSYGICDDQLSLRFKDFKVIKSIVPPFVEQKIIASFLRSKEKKIAQFISNKRRLIQLLKEQKQAIINQAVTRGINPDVKMKLSGVDWLGDVPEHWEVKRLKMLYCNIADQTSSKETDDIYIALEYVESWTGKLSLPSEEIPFESQVKIFYPNDILFGKLRPYLAKVFKPNCKGVCVSEFLVLRDYSNEVLPEFMELKLRSNQIIDLINSSTFGAKMPRADWNFIGNILFSYPTKDEQKSIIEKLVIYIRQRDVLIEKAEKEIELIQEYRTRLISDVVTGKVDVRDIKVEDIEEDELTEDMPDTEEFEDSIEDGKEV